MVQTTLSIQMAHLIAHLLIAGNLLALIVGVLMLVAPHRLEAMFKVSDRWVSTKRTFEPLDLVHDVDGVVFRYPRVLGGILVVGAVFILVRGGLFAAGTSAAEGGRLLARVFGTKLAPVVWEIFWVHMVATMLLGALLALAVGILSFYRMETLKRWSGVANRWVSTHHVFDSLDKPHYGLNKIIHGKSQIWGLLITVFSLCALFLLVWYLRR